MGEPNKKRKADEIEELSLDESKIKVMAGVKDSKDNDLFGEADDAAPPSSLSPNGSSQSMDITGATTGEDVPPPPSSGEAIQEGKETKNGAPVPAPTESEKGSSREPLGLTGAYRDIRWTVVKNDGHPSSMIKLVGLKSLFAKQLPKMPRPYIARLVFDRRHTSLAILSDNPALKDSDEEIIGGICYRAFEDMRFAEIAFCAVSASHQVKGFGTKLMNLLKMTGASTGIEYFITYADNYAIGYFKKQGFTKTIAMPKGRYHGLIKDYDGGTPMECYVHPNVDFCRVPEMLQAQRDFILSRIEYTAMSRKVYDPLPKNFTPDLDGVSRANHPAARAMAIPGVLEAGWTMADLLVSTGQGKEADRQKNALKSELLAIVRKIEEQQFSWPFRVPVDTNDAPDYLEVITEPIDLSTIDKRIRQDNHYKSKQMLLSDLMLMVNNCKLYNEEASIYVQCATSLEKFLGTLFEAGK